MFQEDSDGLPVSNIDDVQLSLPPDPRPSTHTKPTDALNGPLAAPPTSSTHKSSHTSLDKVPAPTHKGAQRGDSSGSVSMNGSHSSSSLPQGSAQIAETKESPRSNYRGGARTPEGTPVANHPSGPPHSGPTVQTPVPVGGANLGMGGAYPMGTLSDLKKQRQQKLQDSLRFKDSSSINKEIQNYNANHAEDNKSNGRTDISDSSLSNGRNASIQSDTVMFGSNTGDPPRKKFTATSEIVGGSESKNKLLYHIIAFLHAHVLLQKPHCVSTFSLIKLYI